VTVTLSGAGNAQNFALYEKLAEDYSAAHPGVTISWAGGVREASELQQQLLRNSIVGATLPDVVFFTGPLLQPLRQAGIVAALDPMIGAETGWDARFSPAVTAPGTIAGGTYGLAIGVSMPVVLFNAALVRQAGGDPADLPRDWPGILDLAHRMDGIAPGTVGGFFEYDNGIGFSWLALLESFGGRVMDASDTRFTFAGPEGLAALSLLRDFGEEAGQAKADMTRDQARAAFGAGTIGVAASMSSLIPRYEEAAAGTFDVVSVPFPVVPGTGRLPVSALIGAVLSQDPAVQAAALGFLEYAAGPEGQLAVATTSGYAPTNLRAIEASPELAAALAGRANAHAYLDNLGVVGGWYVVPGENGLKIADMFLDHLQQVVTLAETPEAALASMQDEASSLFTN
jgi:multiple sugar transport system substrate-binding protein